MRLSVIIPTYQSEKYIAKTLDSIISQSMLPLELVISDDESIDGTIEIILSYARSSPFQIKLVRHKRTGISSNYFNALNYTTGDIIVVGDHDDVWLPNKLKSIHDVFVNLLDVSIISSDSEIVDATLGFTGRTLRGSEEISSKLSILSIKDDFLQYLIGLRLDAHTLAFRSIVKIILNDKLLKNNQNFWFEDKITVAAMSVGKLFLIPEALTLYRQHQSQHIGYSQQQLKLNNMLKRNFDNKLKKLYLLKKMLGHNRKYYLFTESEARRRIALIDQYIYFASLRDPIEFKISAFTKMIYSLLNGTYRRLTRKFLLSFLKDIVLIARKFSFNKLFF